MAPESAAYATECTGRCQRKFPQRGNGLGGATCLTGAVDVRPAGPIVAPATTGPAPFPGKVSRARAVSRADDGPADDHRPGGHGDGRPDRTRGRPGLLAGHESRLRDRRGGARVRRRRLPPRRPQPPGAEMTLRRALAWY